MTTITLSTISDARQYVIDAIGSEYIDDFDVDAIVYEAFERTEDGWTIEDPSDGFWDIVKANDVSGK